MRKEKIQEYTRKISNSNRTELVVILFDMAHTYLEDAKSAYEKENKEDFKEQLRNADRVIANLQEALNYHYEISANLDVLYQFCREQLAESLRKDNIEGLDRADAILCRLQKSFEEVAKKDHSGPLMKNTGRVYAGMTYGKHDLNENFQDSLDASRGFFV